ncbi:hypothetical protein FQA39_LY18910 [Lamprigera yunnana]|nr:hypothetical protein FQA39_LY18910 [Lamprigera yunnana]
MLQLSKPEVEELSKNVRPFNKRIQTVVVRVGFAYFSIEGVARNTPLCQGKFGGGECTRTFYQHCNLECIQYPCCAKCMEVLEEGRAYRLNCNHLLCDQYLQKVPGQIEAVPILQCPTCKKYGFPKKLY